MNARSPLIIALLAVLATTTRAQDYIWHVSDTGDQDGIIEPGEAAVIELELAWLDHLGQEFAWSLFDLIGIAGWAEGEVLTVGRWHCSERWDPPTVTESNDILGIFNFQLPGFFNCGCCGRRDNPVLQLYVSWRPTEYFHREVAVDIGNFIDYHEIPGKMDLYIDDLGAMISLEPITEPLTFHIACPADVIRDGEINTKDFLAFLDLFSTGDVAADFNEDGAVNTRDVIAYLLAWVAGC